MNRLKDKEDPDMMTEQELCGKIRSIYPEIGRCGMDLKVTWDNENKAWMVDLRKNGRRLATYLEPEDVQACLEGTRCVALGVQIAQLQANLGQKI
ncbi:MAG: hypothetical protein AB1512_32115 [Thermodesulfobacteriota bacterium]